MKNIISKFRLSDGFNIIWLSIAGLAVTAFYIPAEVIRTNYPDWIYHAFRAQSLMQHGFLSWDNIWDNGLSYWRGYQLVPGLVTAVIALAFNLSAARAMVLLTMFLFIIFHVVLYVCLRCVRNTPIISAMVIALSFAFSGFWVLVGFYSILFAIVIVPPIILLWYYVDRHVGLRMIFALVVGLSVYVHPLLAVAAGILWLSTLLIHRGQISRTQLAKELFIMAATSFFYWYGLIFVDIGYVAPYQLEKDFLYTVSVSAKYGFIYWILIPFLAFMAVFSSSFLSLRSKYLFWISAILLGLIQLNRFTPILDVLNRYQIYRLNFFIAIALIFVFAELLGKLLVHAPNAVIMGLIGLFIGVGLTQTVIDSSVYGFTPATKIADPVGQYILANPTPLKGSIYIGNSIPGSYYHPNVRFSNGYNDQLLPQIINDRLRGLLSQSSPDYNVTGENINNVIAYVKELGVGYIFLPRNSPYIEPLLAKGGFMHEQDIKSDNFDYVVLVPSWKVIDSFSISSSQASLMSEKAMSAISNTKSASYEPLDRVVQKSASIKYGGQVVPVKLSWPAPDRLTVSAQNEEKLNYVYVGQSFSNGWQANNGVKISRSSDNMMILNAPKGTTKIEMKHTWGPMPWVQLGLGLFVAVLIGHAFVRGDTNA